jgi:hypothetical protein
VRALAAAGLWLAASLPLAIPAGRAVPVLGPTGFPGWQSQGVLDPEVVLDPTSGGWRLYYTGLPTTARSDAVREPSAIGLGTSRDGRRWDYPQDYEPLLLGTRFREGELLDWRGPAARFDALGVSAPAVLPGPGWLMLYTGWAGAERATGPGLSEPAGHAIGLASSPDGVAWTKRPGRDRGGAVLGPGAPGDADAVSAAHPTLLRDPDGTLRLWYEAYDGTTWSLASATSPDGLNWRKLGRVLAPGAPGSADGGGLRQPHALLRGSTLELWYTGIGPGGPQVLRAASRDAGATWTKLPAAVDLHLAEPLQPGEDLRLGSVVAGPDGACHVYFARQRSERRQLTWGEATQRHWWIEAVTVRP